MMPVAQQPAELEGVGGGGEAEESTKKDQQLKKGAVTVTVTFYLLSLAPFVQRLVTLGREAKKKNPFGRQVKL